MIILSDDIYYVEVIAYDQSVQVRHFWSKEVAIAFADQAELEGCYSATLYYLDSTFEDGTIQCLEVGR